MGVFFGNSLTATDSGRHPGTDHGFAVLPTDQSSPAGGVKRTSLFSKSFSWNFLRLDMLALMDHGQHLDEIAGFDLVQNPVGI